jgi:hypothetical protein
VPIYLRLTLFFAFLAAAILLPLRKSPAPQQAAPPLAQRPAVKEQSIMDYLRSGQDARTSLGFKIKTDGSLSEAPTRRIQLLSDLAQTNLPAAAIIAREILAAKTSSDEWALSLAILARSDPLKTNRQFLQQKAEEMVLYGPWRQNPSAGFLEAFDLFVYTDDVHFTTDLAGMVSDKSNPAVAHAAFLTLDRLTENDPQPTLQTFLDDSSLLASHPATEADYFARADARDPAQAQLLAQYLLSPDRTLPELEAFAGIFPNENFIVSDNLLTSNPATPSDEIRSRLQAAAQLASQWQANPQFQSLRPQLARIQNRLASILGLAAQ